MATIPTTRLSNGVQIPVIGIGSSALFGGYGEEATLYALRECGTRLIDTAAKYGTEEDIGKVVKKSGIPREELFIVTKMWYMEMGYESSKAALRKSLDALGLEYVDLYLFHWPNCPEGTADPTKLRQETWKALEECYEQGLCKAIGVSNYEISHLEELKSCRVKPHVNQIEFHPMMDPHREIIKYCKQAGIALMGYSPYCAGKSLSLPQVVDLAKKYNHTPAQISLRWLIQHDVVPIPKTIKKERAKENMQVFDFELSTEDMTLLDNIHKETPYCIAEAQGWPGQN